jgi:2Fe-2S ferredoxin
MSDRGREQVAVNDPRSDPLALLAAPNEHGGDPSESVGPGSRECVVRVEPAGIELTVRKGETVMGAARRLGYRWPTVCDGDGVCTVCWMEVLEGADQLTGRTEVEDRWLRNFRGGRFCKGDLRLACQAVVEGAVSVRKKGVRPTADGS